MNFGISTIYVLIVLGVNTVLSILLFFPNRNRSKTALFYLILSISLWLLANNQVDLSQNESNVLFWSRVVMIGPIWIPFGVLHLTNILTKRYVQNKKYLLWLVAPVILTLFVPTKFFVDSVKFESWGVNFNYGFLYYIFGAYFAVYCIISFARLLIANRKSQGTVKLQIRYMFLGLIIAAFLASMTNIFLPILGIQQLYYLGPFSAVIFLIFTFYAITKHKLLDIRLVILRTVTYSVIVILISAFIVSITLLLPQLVTNVTTQVTIAVTASVILAIALDPLKKSIARTTDKLFFKASINYDVVSQKLSLIINKEIDQTKLLDELESELCKQLKISKSAILLPSQGGASYMSLGHSKIIISQENTIVQYIRKENRVVVFEALERRIEDTKDPAERARLEKSKDSLDTLQAAVITPITSDGRIAAILVLGGKLSGDPYSNDDLNLLQLLGPQLASALEKARLYEEIRLFNVKLQKEVEIATERVKQKNVQLEDRNRYLAAVQKVTNLITQTLEFKKVTQSIVDAISTQLGFVGGVLLFLGESRRKVFPEAITNSPITAKVLKILPKPVNEYWGDYTTDRTMNIEAMKSNQVRIGTRLADFISPPVPAIVCGAVQKLAGIKTIISVPIVAESEVVGCIDFMVAKEPHQITKTEQDMMQAMANQTGVVYRNIELVRRLEGSNRELGEANEHLKELDQAKSEFVSIASHQLRTPMTGIMGYLSMIVGGDFGKVDKELQGILQKLLDESQRMIQLINVFLDVTKIESGKLVLDKLPLHIEDIADKVVSVLQKSASSKKLKLVYVRPKIALPILQMDQKITDVLQNLVDNAIKYTEKGSITISTDIEADQVHVRVKDTGRGLDSKEAKNLFNKFVRGYGIAQVNPDGSGLGLYIARRIIEVHGGKIWVESDGVGKGSTFQFTLPIKPVDTKFEPAGAARVGKLKPVTG